MDDTTLTLQQNIPTPAWGARLVAVDVADGAATVMVELPGQTARPERVHVGDTVSVGETEVRVDAIAGGGHDGPPGRSSGRVTLTRVVAG